MEQVKSSGNAGDGNCDGCYYYRYMRSGGYRYCAYIFYRGNKRPCPPGEGCTVKIGKRRGGKAR